MFDRFKENNVISDKITTLDTVPISSVVPRELNMLLNELGGASFENGLYRVHSLDSSYYWRTIIAHYFDGYKDQIFPFGFDWMGRQFAISTQVSDRILMFDPATGEDFEILESLELFHNESLVNDRLATLSEDIFQMSLKKFKKHKINFNECVGYRLPLFLGGIDSLENYELTDLEVYWDIQSQIYHKIKDLPPGTKINKVSIE